MIDIHSHIVFDVDDGPKTREDTRALLEESYRQGVRTIISTSHRRKGMFETPEEKISENFQEVKKIAAEVAPDLTIHYGAEIYFTNDVLKKLEEKIIPRLADTRFALIEFSMGTPYKEIHTALDRLLHLGVTPVVAQINSSSVLKPRLFGDEQKQLKKRARYFLEKDLVHFVASDMHNVDKRPPYMAEAYRLIKEEYGEQRAQALFVSNQELLLADELI